MAAIWKLSVIFLCENNQFAVSTRHESVCSVEHISQRGSAYNMPSETIDGQNALAVWAAVDRAAQTARAGGGPTLIEAMTYRYGDHSYRMSRLVYRTDEEVAVWRRNDPIENLEQALATDGLADASELTEVRDRVDDEIKAALEFARASSYPTADTLWERMYVDASGFRDRRHHREWFAATAARKALAGGR
jgi:TPP-dependent pyruvate/acetoin dehydrogenase alpha subunit